MNPQMKNLIGHLAPSTNVLRKWKSCAASIMDTTLPLDFKEFLSLLNDNDVAYLVISGYAVGYYGYPRATNGMNIGVALIV